MLAGEIPMNDPLLRGLEGLGYLPCNRQNIGDRHGLVRNPIGERWAFDQFKDESCGTRGVLDPVDGSNVGVIQRCEDTCLPAESREGIRIARHGGLQNLERDIAIELRVTRPIHIAHSAGAE
jgi:hypothetical protein